jgi:aminoglycoside phosphotransferase (APT) family kinase protein
MKAEVEKLLVVHSERVDSAKALLFNVPKFTEFGMTIGDLSLNQILFDRRGKAIALIDWEYAGGMNLLADDVSSCLFRSFLRAEGTINLRAMSAFIESYQITRHSPPDFWQAVAARLYEGSQQHVLGLVDHWLSGRPYEVSKKTRQFLDRRLLISYRAMNWLTNHFDQVESAISKGNMGLPLAR